jgi:hypothetical protein
LTRLKSRENIGDEEVEYKTERKEEIVERG